MRILGARILSKFSIFPPKNLEKGYHKSEFTQPRQFSVNTFNKPENENRKRNKLIYKFWFQGNIFFKIAFDSRFRNNQDNSF